MCGLDGTFFLPGAKIMILSGKEIRRRHYAKMWRRRQLARIREDKLDLEMDEIKRQFQEQRFQEAAATICSPNSDNSLRIT
jgi:hypothetical protein